ncbi:hypothetical protein BH11ARM2_BH11ARM2_22560 [soil metagenome]
MIALTVALLALAPAPLIADKTVDLPKAGGFDALAFDSQNHRVLAAHSGAGTLAVLDTETGKVEEIDTGSINGVAVSKKLDRYFVAGGGKELVAIDRKSLKVVGRVALSGPADLLAVDTKRGHVVVCHDDGTEDWVFDGASLAPVGTIVIEEAPEFIEYDKTTDRIYQNIKSTDHLQVIDPETRKVVATWDTAPMKSPHGLALDKKAGRAYSAGKNGKLVVLDMATGKVVQTLDIAPGTDGIAIDAKLGRVYCPGKGKMTVVSTADGTVMGEIDLPAGAKNLAVDTATHTVWVSVTDDKGAHLASFKPSP